jgi:hypothetical protein
MPKVLKNPSYRLIIRRTACMCVSLPLFQKTGLQQKRGNHAFSWRTVWGIPLRFGSRLTQHFGGFFIRLIVRQLKDIKNDIKSALRRIKR